MPQTTDTGPRTFAYAKAVSSLSYSPPADREFLGTRILIQNPSAKDTWTVSVGGRELFRAIVDTVGNNQLFGGNYTNLPKTRDIFSWYYELTGDYLYIPVPNALSVTVASVGGATADIIVGGMDMTRGSITPGYVNHYQGNHFVIPMQVYLSAAATAAGETALDTEIKPSWVPSLFLGLSMRPGFRFRLLAAFLESASVNTFSGSANHVSSTDHLAVVRNGEHLFSHVQLGQTSGLFATVTVVPAGNLVAPGGIPLLSSAAAAGSANTVYPVDAGPYQAFQEITEHQNNVFDPPITMSQGDILQLLLGLTGDFTGNPSYASAYMTFLVEFYKDL